MTTPKDRAELIQFRAKSMREHWRTKAMSQGSPIEDIFLGYAEATTQAEEAAGLAVVPVEPTYLMKSLGYDTDKTLSGAYHYIYQAMLAASPYREDKL